MRTSRIRSLRRLLQSPRFSGEIPIISGFESCARRSQYVFSSSSLLENGLVSSVVPSIVDNSKSPAGYGRWLSTLDGPNDEDGLEKDETYDRLDEEFPDEAEFDDDEFETVRHDAEDDDFSWDDDGGGKGSRKDRAGRGKKSRDSNDQEAENETPEGNRRIFFDPQLSLEDRVNRIINRRLGELHYLDITLSSIELIRECGKLNSFEGMKYAHDIMDRIIEEKHFVNQQNEGEESSQLTSYQIVIPERVFEVLMYGWSNLCRRVSFAPQRMRKVLDLMIQEAEYDQNLREQRRKEGVVTPEPKVLGKKHTDVSPEEMFANMSCEPTVGIYNTLLQGLAQASYRSIAAADEAEDVLRLMDRVAHRRGWHTKPNTKSFMQVINGFSRTGHATSGDRAEGVLRRMIDYHEEQLGLYEEETGTEYDVINPSNNSRQIVTPDAIAYTAVIQAHGESDSNQSAEKALLLLTELIQSSHPCLKADAFVFSVTINAFAKMAAKKMYWKERLEAAQSAEKILWLMVDTLQSESADTSKYSYVVPFNACLNAWAQSNTREGPTRAERLLQKMLDPDVHAKTGVRPNAVSFNTCMQAWVRAARDDPQAPQKAEDLLHLLGQLDHVDADVISYTTVMRAYAKSDRPDKAIQARRIFETLLTTFDTMPNGTRMSAIPFTVVLNAVSHSSNTTSTTDEDAFGLSNSAAGDLSNESEDVYGIALKTYNELSTDLYELGVTADHLAFATMLDVIRQNTSPDSIERRQRIENIFGEACTAGEVSAMVVQAMVKACPSKDMLQTLLRVRSYPIQSVNALPREWIRRVDAKFLKLRVTDAKSNRRNPEGGRKGGPQRGNHNMDANRKDQKRHL